MFALAQKSRLVTTADIYNSLFSGQTFRWRIIDKKKPIYLGVIGNTITGLRRDNNRSITIFSSSDTILEKSPVDFFNDYFTLDIDADTCLPEFLKTEKSDIWTLLQRYKNIKVLRQQPFETLITFMCAQGIGMKIIRSQVENLCRHFGSRIETSIDNDTVVVYSFPEPETLASLKPHELLSCTNNNHIRASNIISAAAAVADGSLDLDSLRSPALALDEARNALMAQRGIGLKIADCILLFGLQRFDAFPIDTHVHQYLAAWFGIEEAAKSLTQKRYLSLQQKAITLLGPDLAGYAGHILFHCWRKEVKRLDTAL